MIPRIRQEIAFSGAKVSGYYRYGNLFQLRPMHETSLALETVIGHHPFLLEFSYLAPSLAETGYNPDLPTGLIEPMIDEEAAARAKKWIFLVLAAVSKTRIFQYSHRPSQQSWFVGLPRGSSPETVPHLPQWGQVGYNHNGITAWLIDSFSDPNCPAVRQIQAQAYYQTETPQQHVVGMTPDELELPDRIGDLIAAYLNLSPEDKVSFLSSCFLFDQSIQLFWQAPSLAFSASVTSLETLITVDHKGEKVEHCECCNQPLHRVRQNFLAFIQTYGSDAPGVRKFADRIYERRCAVLHEGQLAAGEVHPRTIDGAIEWIADDESRRTVIKFFRACLLNWLMARSEGTGKAL
jgi:hypothetical protein